MKKYFIPGIVLLILVFTGIRYRGSIRLKMLSFLHSFDDSTEQVDEGEYSLAPWRPVRIPVAADNGMTESESQQIDQLRSLGYLSGYENAPEEMGITVYDSTRACQGYNILLSGPNPGVFLLNMNGEVVHTWYNNEISLLNLWPDAQENILRYPTSFVYWRRCYLSDNGDMTIVIEGGGVVRLDKDSNILWVSECIGAHHDIDITPDGNVYVLGVDMHINSRYSTDKLIMEDYICILDSMGNVINKFSLLDAIANSDYAPTLRRLPDEGDMLHTNTIKYITQEMLPEGYTGPLRPGTVLLSHRRIDLVSAVNLEEESVYWAISGLWHKQHQPTLLSDGMMLILDNQGRRDSSTVLEFDPQTGEILWFYRGDDDNPFYTEALGSCQRLRNGNTLIVESTFGRAFEVTPGGEIVWEYYNPHRAGDNNELIGMLVDVVRIAPEEVESWL